MKKKYTYPLLASTMFLAGLSLFNSETVYADTIGFPVISDWLGSTPGVGLPPAMRITAQNPEYSYYNKIGDYKKSNNQSGGVFFRTLYDDSWTVYTPVATGSMKEWSSLRYEEQLYYNSRSWKDDTFNTWEYKQDVIEYSKYKNQNIKSKKATRYNLGRGYRGFIQNATDTIESGTFKGKKGEFRVMGYSEGGGRISNPEFPNDFYSATDASQTSIANYGWDTKPWTQNNDFVGKGTGYDVVNSPTSLAYKIKYNAIKRLVEQEPSMGSTSGTNIKYWMKRLSLTNDPSDGTAAYFVGTKHNGINYVTLIAKATPKIKKNLTLTQQVVYDSDGKEIIKFTRSGTNENGTVTKGSSFRKLVSGEKITVKTTIKNNSDKGSSKISAVKGLAAYATGKNADTKASSLTDSTTDKIFNLKGGSLTVGNSTAFSTEMTVPSNDNKLAVLGQIDNEMYYKGDNLNLLDDSSYMSIAVNNEMGNFKASGIHLIDKSGKEVSNPLPGENYKIRYDYSYESKTKKASESVKLTLSYKVNRNLPGNSKDATVGTLSTSDFKPENGKSYSFTTKDYVTYETGIFDTNATLAISKNDTNYNTNTKDDAQNVDFKYSYDLAVKNTSLIPQTESNTDVKTMNYLLKFDVDYSVPGHVKNHAKDVTFEVNVGGTKQTVTEHIENGQNKNITVEVAVPTTGKNKTVNAKIVANSNKQVYEVDYTSNNSATATAAIKNEDKVKAYTGKSNPSNSWKQALQTNTWTSKKASYKGFNNGKTYDFTNYLNGNEKDESFDLNENYKIQHVWFRSKMTNDLNEGPKKDGWVDLMKDPGKIKAGYGYELKVDVKYDTDAFSKLPKETASKWVRPSVSAPNLPNNLYIQTPDAKIHSVNGDGKTTKSLSFSRSDASSPSKTEWTFQVAPVETLGVQTLGKFYIGSEVKDGTYDLNVFTPKTSGVLGKMTSSTKVVDEKLFDQAKDLKIKVMGSATDDLNDHINQ